MKSYYDYITRKASSNTNFKIAQQIYDSLTPEDIYPEDECSGCCNECNNTDDCPEYEEDEEF